MTTEYNNITDLYRSALEHYLGGDGERALQTAYELGRKTMASSLGVLDLAKIHQEALQTLMAAPDSNDYSRSLACRASEFFSEALTPFEMTHRGFRETIESLRKLNETLEYQVHARTTALSRSEEQYRLITENAHDLIYMLNPEGKFIYISPSFTRILGYVFDDLKEINCLDLIHPDDRSKVGNVFRRSLFAHDGLMIRFRYRRKEGGYVPFESVWNWAVDDSGTPQRAVIDSRDISERIKSEEKLSLSEMQYRRLFESAKEGILLIDVESWTIRDANPHVLSLSGFALSEIIGAPLKTLSGLSPIEEHLKPLRSNLREDMTVEYTDRIVRKDGRTIDVEVVANLFSIGETTVIQCNLHEITERRRNERRQHIQHDITRILAESSLMAEATPQLLEALCRNLEWEVGVMWEVDRKAHLLRCIEVWHAAGVDIGEFEQVSKKRTLASGVGLPGRVWASGAPEWTRDISTTNYLHPPAIGDEELHGGFGIPIRLGSEVLGVIECFSRDIQSPDEHLLALLSVVGSQIGQFFERKRAEEALRESEERYRTVAETASDSIIAMDEESTILFVNHATEKVFGYTTTELVGQKLLLLMPDYLRYSFTTALRRYLQTGDRHAGWQGIEIPGRHRSGETIPLEISYGESVQNGKRYFIGIARDIRDRKKAEESVHRSKEQLRNLSARLQTVREEERRWIAREIHDELGQALTGIRMYLSWMQTKVGAEEGSAFAPLLLAKMNSMSQLIDTTIQSVQRIVTELRPGVLDDLGLLAAIEWQAQEFENRTGISCRVETHIQEMQFDDQRSTAVFRIFQETLTNVARHAEATTIAVRMEESAGRLLLEIHDNGKGIREEDITAPKSLGLLGIRERAGIFGGEVDIHRAPAGGTTVSVVIPIERASMIQST